MDQEQQTGDMSSEEATQEVTPVTVDMSINERQFHDTVPTYVTFPHVSFDGVNFHLVFLTGTPVPIDNPSTSHGVRVAARLVMPPVTLDATIRAMIDSIQDPRPVGIFADMVREAEPQKADSDE